MEPVSKQAPFCAGIFHFFMTRSAAAPLFDMWCKSEDIPFFNSRAAAKIRYWPVNPLHFIRRIGGSAVGANPVQPSN